MQERSLGNAEPHFEIERGADIERVTSLDELLERVTSYYKTVRREPGSHRISILGYAPRTDMHRFDYSEV